MTKNEIAKAIYKAANHVIRQDNPCDFVNGRCTRDRSEAASGTGACCYGCRSLTEKGCSIVSLGCKLWYCTYIGFRHPHFKGAMDALKMLTALLHIPSNNRNPME